MHQRRPSGARLRDHLRDVPRGQVVGTTRVVRGRALDDQPVHPASGVDQVGTRARVAGVADAPRAGGVALDAEDAGGLAVRGGPGRDAVAGPRQGVRATAGVDLVERQARLKELGVQRLGDLEHELLVIGGPAEDQLGESTFAHRTVKQQGKQIREVVQVSMRVDDRRQRSGVDPQLGQPLQAPRPGVDQHPGELIASEQVARRAPAGGHLERSRTEDDPLHGPIMPPGRSGSLGSRIRR